MPSMGRGETARGRRLPGADRKNAIQQAVVIDLCGFTGVLLGVSLDLDERYPGPSLLPDGVRARAHVRALAHMVPIDAHMFPAAL